MEGLAEVRQDQGQGCTEGCLQILECNFMFQGPEKWEVLLGEVSNRGGNSREVLYKLAVKVGKSHKRLYIVNRGRSFPGLDGIGLSGAGGYTIGRDNITQVINRGLEE